MKNLAIIAALAALFLAACGQHDHAAHEATKSTAPAQPEAATTAAPSLAREAVYACPMHPEITGKEGDKCSNCRMDLKPVKK